MLLAHRRCAAQAPHLCRYFFVSNFIIIRFYKYFLFYSIFISFVYQTLHFNISFYISNNQYFEEYDLYSKTYIDFLYQLLIYQIYNKTIKAYISHLYIYKIYTSCNAPKKRGARLQPYKIWLLYAK